jgi:hypothetical protein
MKEWYSGEKSIWPSQTDVSRQKQSGGGSGLMKKRGYRWLEITFGLLGLGRLIFLRLVMEPGMVEGGSVGVIRFGWLGAARNDDLSGGVVA